MHCHAFTVAIDRVCNGGGEALVRVDAAGNVAHSVYRLPHTRVYVDETGPVTLDAIPGLSWRSATIAEIARMATSVPMRRKVMSVLANGEITCER